MEGAGPQNLCNVYVGKVLYNIKNDQKFLTNFITVWNYCILYWIVLRTLSLKCRFLLCLASVSLFCFTNLLSKDDEVSCALQVTVPIVLNFFVMFQPWSLRKFNWWLAGETTRLSAQVSVWCSQLFSFRCWWILNMLVLMCVCSPGKGVCLRWEQRGSAGAWRLRWEDVLQETWFFWFTGANQDACCGLKHLSSSHR